MTFTFQLRFWLLTTYTSFFSASASQGLRRHRFASIRILPHGPHIERLLDLPLPEARIFMQHIIRSRYTCRSPQQNLGLVFLIAVSTSRLLVSVEDRGPYWYVTETMDPNQTESEVSLRLKLYQTRFW